MQKGFYGLYALLVPFAILLIALVLNAARDHVVTPMQTVNGGDVARGEQAIKQYGCGSCHIIPGVEGANGMVGPPLVDLAERRYIAGRLQNTPENLVHWIRFPQEVAPGVDMPDLGVTEQAALDMAAYLYRHP